jgi:hypothetical protein
MNWISWFSLIWSHTVKELDWMMINELYQNQCPNVLAVFDLLLTLPAGTSECERGFWQMVIVKTKYRNRLHSTTMTMLMTIALHSDDIPDFDPYPTIHHWLIIYGFTSRSRIFHVHCIWRRHHCRWRAAKFWLTLGAQGLWAGRDLYRATPAVTRDLGFFGLIRRTAPFSRLVRHAWGCGGSILTRILKGIIHH